MIVDHHQPVPHAVHTLESQPLVRGGRPEGAERGVGQGDRVRQGAARGGGSPGGASDEVAAGRGHDEPQGGERERGAAWRQDTRRVFRRMKSIKMNCPSVIVFVKYALPRQIALTFFTNSTRLRSRASMNVLIRIPERRHNATSRYVAWRIWGSRPIELT